MLLFTHRDRPTTSSRRSRASTRFRPTVDGLEGRALLSTVALSAAQVRPIAAQQAAVPVFSVDTARDRLLATVTLNGQPVTVAVDPQPLTTPTGQPQRLLLRVDAVTQNVRGLAVQSSPFNVTLNPDTSALGLLLGTITATQRPVRNLPALASSLNTSAAALAALTGSAGGADSLLNLSSLTFVNRQLTATGTLLGQPFNRAVTVGTSPGASRQRPNLTLTLPPGSDNPQFQTDAITLTVSPQAGRLNRNANLLLQVTRPLARTGNVNSRLVNQLLNRLRG